MEDIMSNDALADLHTALVDARKGYEEAIEKSDNPGLTALFREMHTLHGAAHGDIHGLLVAKGAHPDDDGSFMGTVHKAVISVRSAITGLDDNSLASFASGEESTLAKYDEAIRDEDDAGVTQTLRGHRDRLAAKVGEMKRLAA
jgi:uncharacterized protein (TIGR02284 family)